MLCFLPLPVIVKQRQESNREINNMSSTGVKQISYFTNTIWIRISKTITRWLWRNLQFRRKKRYLEKRKTREGRLELFPADTVAIINDPKLDSYTPSVFQNLAQESRVNPVNNQIIPNEQKLNSIEAQSGPKINPITDRIVSKLTKSKKIHISTLEYLIISTRHIINNKVSVWWSSIILTVAQRYT